MAYEGSFHVKYPTIFFRDVSNSHTKDNSGIFLLCGPSEQSRERTGGGGEDMKGNSKRKRKGRGEKGRGKVGKVWKERRGRGGKVDRG